MALLWAQNRKRFGEIAFWLLDYGMQFVAVVLIALRGVVPDFVSIVIANMFLIGGTIVLLHGLRRFVGKPRRLAHNYWMFAVFTLVHAYFALVQPSLAVRNVNLACALFYLCVQGCWLMLREVDDSLRAATRATGIVFAGFCVTCLAQIVNNSVRSQPKDFLHSDLLGSLSVLAYQILFLALTFALTLLVSRQLRTELERELAEHHQADQELQRNRRFLAELIEHSGALISTKDREGRYELVNRKWEEMTGIKRELALGRTDGSLFSNEAVRQAHAHDLEVLETGATLEKEEELETERGKRCLLAVKFPLRGDDGNIAGVCSMTTDITERKQAEEQIRHLATHDHLTNLPSLNLARDRLTMAIRMARREKRSACVMFIDLDGFKNVNDTRGHEAGDRLLKEVSRRLVSRVRQTDTVARIGGDEFLVIASGLHGADDAMLIAKKLLDEFGRPIAIEPYEALVSASIGIALFPEHGDDIEQLIKHADEAMYRVKKARKNGICFAE
jgi:diguanylate cyclase (GGDEF)-like protein/PAS domain S-box-containing protein